MNVTTIPTAASAFIPRKELATLNITVIDASEYLEFESAFDAPYTLSYEYQTGIEVSNWMSEYEEYSTERTLRNAYQTLIESNMTVQNVSAVFFDYSRNIAAVYGDRADYGVYDSTVEEWVELPYLSHMDAMHVDCIAMRASGYQFEVKRAFEVPPRGTSRAFGIATAAPVIESVPTAYARAESLPDGTYVGSRSGAFTRYDSHQGYGYAVGIAPATEETLKQDGRTFGVWTDPVSGRKYIDDVVHVWTIQDAVRLARRHDQIAFWSFDTGAAISTANAYDMILPED